MDFSWSLTLVEASFAKVLTGLFEKLYPLLYLLFACLNYQPLSTRVSADFKGCRKRALA